MIDLSLYLVTDPELTADTGLTTVVRQAVAGGVSVVQVRDKTADVQGLRDQVAQLRRAGVWVPIIVNDSVEGAIGADGVHLGQGDADPVRARQVLGPQAIIGLSVTSVQQAQAALRLPAGTLDYLGVGPVWPTATKPDHAPALGMAGVREVVTWAGGLPCVAIGGVTTGPRLQSLRGTGVVGVCVVSAICAAPDPQAAAAELRTEWKAR